MYKTKKDTPLQTLTTKRRLQQKKLEWPAGEEEEAMDVEDSEEQGSESVEEVSAEPEDDSFEDLVLSELAGLKRSIQTMTRMLQSLQTNLLQLQLSTALPLASSPQAQEQKEELETKSLPLTSARVSPSKAIAQTQHRKALLGSSSSKTKGAATPPPTS